MSASRRKRERELSRLQRRMNTQPDRPILRAAERQPRSSLPPEQRPDSVLDTPTTPPPSNPSISRSQSHTPHPEALPLWTRLLPLSLALDSDFRAFLFRFVEDQIRPTDDHEHWLASRIALAMARLHLNAQREPDPPTPAWLRYEQLADRQLRAAQRELKNHRAHSLPIGAESLTGADRTSSPTSTPTQETSSAPPRREPPGEILDPSPARDPARNASSPQQTPRNPHNPTFARTPSASVASDLAEMHSLLTWLADHRSRSVDAGLPPPPSDPRAAEFSF